MEKEKPTPPAPAVEKPAPAATGGNTGNRAPAEIGGRRGPEPTRYGDWENGGKCVDF